MIRTMRVGLISDIHSNIYGLTSVLKKLGDVDSILCAGDIVGYYPFVNEVFDELAKYKVVFVKGNHDAFLCGENISNIPLLDLQPREYANKTISKVNRDTLQNACKEFSFGVNGIKVAMFHGSPWDKLEGYIYPDYQNFHKFSEIDADVIILGHTHYPMVKRVDGKLIVNPGSCGQPRDYDPRASFAVLDTLTREVQFGRVEYDVEAVCDAVQKLGFDTRLSEILRRTK